MIRLFAPGRHFPLLVALTALFLLYPLMVELDRLRLLRFAFVALLVATAYSLGGKRRKLWIALVFAAPAAAGQIAAYVAPGGDAPAAALLFALLFLTYTTVLVMRSVLTEGPVTHDKLAGAISAYLLLGLVWAIAYALVALFVPGAFRIPEDILLQPGGVSEYTFIYYSFVTLSTLGYGDITPVSVWSQTLSWMEAVVGPLFLAILIARLVGLHIYHSTSEE